MPVVPVDSRALRVMLIIMMMGRTRGMRAETDEERAKEGCGGGTAMLDLSGGRLTLPPIFPCRHLVKTIPSMAAFLTLNHVLKYIMRTQLGITTFPHTLVRQSPLSVSLSFVRHPLSRFRRTQSKNQQHPNLKGQGERSHRVSAVVYCLMPDPQSPRPKPFQTANPETPQPPEPPQPGAGK